MLSAIYKDFLFNSSPLIAWIIATDDGADYIGAFRKSTIMQVIIRCYYLLCAPGSVYPCHLFLFFLLDARISLPYYFQTLKLNRYREGLTLY